MQTLSPGSSAGVVITGVDQRILWASPALGKILGYEEVELIGRNLGEFTHADDVSLDAHLAGRLLAGEIATYEICKRFIDKSEAIIPLRVVASMIRDHDGRPLYGVAIIDSPYQFPGVRTSTAATVDPRDLDRIRNAILM
jgi:PAS domain S-box-containing protein